MKDGQVITLAQYFHELQQAAPGLALDHVEFLGDSYWCPSLEWLIQFGRYVRDTRLDYVADCYVCEQFARAAAADADAAMLEACRDSSDIPRLRHSFGEARGLLLPSSNATGLSVTGKAHALNLCRCSDGVIYEFDPQCSEDEKSIVPLGSTRCTFRPNRFRV